VPTDGQRNSLSIFGLSLPIQRLKSDKLKNRSRNTTLKSLQVFVNVFVLQSKSPGREIAINMECCYEEILIRHWNGFAADPLTIGSPWVI